MQQTSFVRPAATELLTQGLVLLCVGIGGCFGKPNAANVELRKQNQQLSEELKKQQAINESDKSLIAGLRSRQPTTATLPSATLDKLFTVHQINFGRLTGGYAVAPSKADTGVKVYIVPVDESNQPLKAAGSFVIDVFDLAAGDDARVAHYTFDLDQAKQRWYGSFVFDYFYVLECPWTRVPAHADLTVRVTFTDELTQVPFTAQRQIHVNLPAHPTSEPTTTPASR